MPQLLNKKVSLTGSPEDPSRPVGPASPCEHQCKYSFMVNWFDTFTKIEQK